MYNICLGRVHCLEIPKGKKCQIFIYFAASCYPSFPLQQKVSLHCFSFHYFHFTLCCCEVLICIQVCFSNNIVNQSMKKKMQILKIISIYRSFQFFFTLLHVVFNADIVMTCSYTCLWIQSTFNFEVCASHWLLCNICMYIYVS